MTRWKRQSDRSGRAPLPSPGRPPVAGRNELRRFWAAVASGLSSEDAAAIDEHASKIEMLLLAVSKAVSVNPKDADRNDALLRTIKEELPSYMSDINLFDAQGQNIGTSADADRKIIFAGDRLYFQAVMHGEELGVGEPILARSSQQWTISLARPIKDAEGKVIAVIAAGTFLERLHEVTATRDLPEGSVIAILNDKHRVLGRSIGGPEWINRDLSHLARVAGHNRKKEVSTVGIWADGITRITGTTSASRVPWFVSVGLPEHAAVIHMVSHVRWNILLVLAALWVAGAIAWIFAGRIVRPLRQLSKDARVFASGDLRHRSTISTRDELGQLAHTLNEMAAAIEKRQHEADGAREEAAKEAEERGRLFETSLDLIIITDRQGILQRVSPSSMDLLGYAPEEMIGRSAAEFVEIDDLERTCAEMRAARTLAGALCLIDVFYSPQKRIYDRRRASNERSFGNHSFESHLQNSRGASDFFF